jgi:hypothetical protein
LYRRGFLAAEINALRTAEKQRTLPKGTEIVIIVAGARAARELQELIPGAKVVCLVADELTLLKRIDQRYSPLEKKAWYIKKIKQYQELGVEDWFEHTFNTGEPGIQPIDILVRIELAVGLPIHI